jgi:hypothetical protein
LLFQGSFLLNSLPSRNLVGECILMSTGILETPVKTEHAEHVTESKTDASAEKKGKFGTLKDKIKTKLNKKSSSDE